MTKYEKLLDRAVDEGCVVKEIDFEVYDGLTVGNVIGIRKSIPTYKQKASVLGEELSHHFLTVGNILDQNDANNRKQEYKARSYAHDMLIGLEGIVDAYDHGCQSAYEIALYLEVSEEFLLEALAYYHEKYGEYVDIDNHRIYFEPSLNVSNS